MKPINVYPIEDFLEKARLALKTNQKNLTLSQKEVSDLSNSLTSVMTRLVGQMDKEISSKDSGPIVVKMDGGRF